MKITFVYNLDNDLIDIKEGETCSFILDCNISIKQRQHLKLSCKEFSEALKNFIYDYCRKHTEEKYEVNN